MARLVVVENAISNSPFEEPERQYNFLSHGDARGDPINLIVEAPGPKEANKPDRPLTARSASVPALNNAGTRGFWVFPEAPDLWDAKAALLAAVGGEQHEEGKTDAR